MDTITLSGAEAVLFSDGQTERDARLLVAGEYPGKGLTVTEADLDALVSHFSGPVPVKVEHMDTPLDPLGLVQRVWREGAALMGRVAFPAEMGAFLSRRGAAKLSVGLLKEPAWRLLEVSLTHTPHVPTATLLSDGQAAELVTLRAERLEGQITALKAAGKIVPAAEALARALLAAPAVVTLSDGPAPAGEAFRRFLEAQPAVVTLGETARVTLTGGASGAAASVVYGAGAEDFTADEHEVLRRLGADPAAVRKTMTADRAMKGAK